MTEPEIYYADYLKKEDHSGKWRIYWASLNASGLHFRLGKTVEGNENFQQCIELTPESRCALAKRRMYSFRFKLVIDGETYTLKCESVLQRYRWMYMIDLVVNGRPRESPPNAVSRAFNINATENNMNGVDEKDSCNQRNSKPRNSVARSSSFTILKNIDNWRKRNNSLPPTRCLRKKANLSNSNSTKTSEINCSFNFAENMAFFDD